MVQEIRDSNQPVDIWSKSRHFFIHFSCRTGWCMILSINCMKGSPSPPPKKKVTIRCGVTPSWDAMVTIRMLRSFSTEPSFFHYYCEGGGANPNYAQKGFNRTEWRSRSKQNQQPNKRKEAKKKRNKSYKKTFPYPPFHEK